MREHLLLRGHFEASFHLSLYFFMFLPQISKNFDNFPFIDHLDRKDSTSQSQLTESKSQN